VILDVNAKRAAAHALEPENDEAENRPGRRAAAHRCWVFLPRHGTSAVERLTPALPRPRNSAKLLQHAELVKDVPTLDDLSIHNSLYAHPGDSD
jgi:hypothetical protein